LSNEYRIAETKTFQKIIHRYEYERFHEKLESHVYPVLRENPHYGQHIKKLKGEFREIYRYRISDYRLFYTIDERNRIVFMLDFHHRKDAYR
jgi:mRNA interferase RelE/StbE